MSLTTLFTFLPRSHPILTVCLLVNLFACREHKTALVCYYCVQYSCASLVDSRVPVSSGASLIIVMFHFE